MIEWEKTSQLSASMWIYYVSDGVCFHYSISIFWESRKKGKKRHEGDNLLLFTSDFLLAATLWRVFYNGDIFFLPISLIVTAQGTLNNSKWKKSLERCLIFIVSLKWIQRNIMAVDVLLEIPIKCCGIALLYVWSSVKGNNGRQ